MEDSSFILHLSQTPEVLNELAWMREVLDEKLYDSILACEKKSRSYGGDMTDDGDCNTWPARRVALRRRLDTIPLPNLGWASWLAHNLRQYLGIGINSHDEN